MITTVAKRDELVLREIEHLCHTGLTPGTLSSRVTERLAHVVPFAGYAVVTIDPLTELATDFIFDAALGSEEDIRFFVENIYFEDDVLDYGWMARNRVPAMTLSKATGGRLERALRYREYNHPRGFGPEVRAVLTANGKPWGGLCLVRRKGVRDFCEREVAFLRRVSSHMGAGLRAAALRYEAELSDAAPVSEPAGVLILDRSGRVKQRTAAAKHLLRELYPQDNGTRNGDGLPMPVCSALGALRHTLESEGVASERAPILHARGRSGRWFTLQASLAEPVSGDRAETVVIIAPVNPEELAEIRTDAYGLSNREKEVVGYVLQGCSTREISRTLFISESTVQGHLAHVFEKTGVKSRRELVKRLFLNNLPIP